MVASSLGCNVLEVLASRLAGIFLVPGIRHGSQPRQVALVSNGVEEKETVEHLETGKVTACGVVVILDEIEFHLRLVGMDEALYHRVTLLKGEVAILCCGANGTFQFSQFQTEQANGVTCATSLYLVTKGHIL